MGLGWNPGEVFLTARAQNPVVAGECGTTREQGRKPRDDRCVFDAELRGSLGIAGDELAVWHERLKRQIRAAVLRVTTAVGCEQLRVDSSNGFEQRSRSPQ